jgi:predicted transcriptional regulator of viral defense system
MIMANYPELTASTSKLRRMVYNNELIRLRRNLYIPVQNEINTLLVANYIISPSYVSGLTALWYYGIIPETVHEVFSMTTKRTKTFQNELGYFRYHNCSENNFYLGIETKTLNGQAFLVAGKEKAIIDYIETTPNLNLRYKRETLEWMENDMRMDTEELSSMNLNIFKQYMLNGKKTNMLSNIVKIFS